MKRRLIRIVITFVILGVFAWYVAANWQQFSELRFAQPLHLLPAALFTAVSIYGIGVLLAASLQPLGVRLSKHELFGLASLNRFCNLIAPGYLGAAVRAVYLKRTYKFSFASFSSSFIVSSLILFLISGLLALLSFFLQGSTLSGDTSSLISIMALAVLFFVVSLVIPLGAPQRLLDKANKRRRNKLLDRLGAVLDGFIKIRAQPSLFYKMTFWAIVTVVGTSITTLLLYQTLAYQIGFMEALFIAAVSSWGIIISITPANIGIREGLMVVAAQIMSVPIPETLAVAILLRLVAFVVAAALSAYYAPKLLHVSLANIGSLERQPSKVKKE